jgi:hypothetical protein
MNSTPKSTPKLTKNIFSHTKRNNFLLAILALNVVSCIPLVGWPDGLTLPALPSLNGLSEYGRTFIKDHPRVGIAAASAGTTIALAGWYWLHHTHTEASITPAPVVPKKITRTIELRGAASPQSEQPATPQVTVWIHGTNLLKLCPLSILPINRTQRFPPKGFYLASLLPQNHRIGKIITTLSESAPTIFPLEHFYVFG